MVPNGSLGALRPSGGRRRPAAHPGRRQRISAPARGLGSGEAAGGGGPGSAFRAGRRPTQWRAERIRRGRARGRSTWRASGRPGLGSCCGGGQVREGVGLVGFRRRLCPCVCVCVCARARLFLFLFLSQCHSLSLSPSVLCGSVCVSLSVSVHLPPSFVLIGKGADLPAKP